MRQEEDESQPEPPLVPRSFPPLSFSLACDRGDTVTLPLDQAGSLGVLCSADGGTHGSEP